MGHFQINISLNPIWVTELLYNYLASWQLYFCDLSSKRIYGHMCIIVVFFRFVLGTYLFSPYSIVNYPSPNVHIWLHLSDFQLFPTQILKSVFEILLKACLVWNLWKLIWCFWTWKCVESDFLMWMSYEIFKNLKICL